MSRYIVTLIALIVLTSLPLPANALSLHLISFRTPHQKMVTLTLRNGTEIARDIRIEDKVITLGPNERYKLTAPVGTIVYANGPSAHHANGDIILQIIADLNGTTCSFN